MASTPSVSDIACALESALSTALGIQTFPYLPDTFTPPVAMVEIDEVEYHGAFAGGNVTHTFTVFVIVSRVSDRSAGLAVQGFMSQKGDNSPNSIQGAIEADPTLGGIVSTLIVEKSGPLAPVTISGADVIYLCVPFTVTVHA
jgi:hypothetical protein